MPLHRVWVAGTKHYDAPRLPVIPEGVPLVLEREPDNPHDSNAVSVAVRATALAYAGIPAESIPDGDTFKLGNLPASKGPNYARMVAQIIDAGGEVTAKMRRCQDNGQIRITIESDKLPPGLAA